MSPDNDNGLNFGFSVHAKPSSSRAGIPAALERAINKSVNSVQIVEPGFFKADFLAVGQIPFVFDGPVSVIDPADAPFFVVGLFTGVFIIDFQPDAAVVV